MLQKFRFSYTQVDVVLQPKTDELVKSLNNLSFRAKRPPWRDRSLTMPRREKPGLGQGEIFPAYHAENIRFLPAVEMTYSLNPTFYETIKTAGTAANLVFQADCSRGNHSLQCFKQAIRQGLTPQGARRYRDGRSADDLRAG